MHKLKIFVVFLVFVQINCGIGESVSELTNPQPESEATPIITGAGNVSTYLPLIKGKNVALVVNQTTTIGKTHLVDTLIKMQVNVQRIFAPEHGFRGEADAGEKLQDGVDSKTGIPLVSLYGKKRKPSAADLKDLDWVIFDIQDVGARFYTYISTMHNVMEACANHKVPFMVLDRPNPNGHYVDGPILNLDYQSFVGMHEVPIVHGMTIGEYARMINGEKWLKDGVQCDLTVIPCLNYNHNRFYELPIKPSPNLPNMRSIYLYPSICFFEGTVASEGRGTDLQFQVYGHPDFTKGDFEFTPVSKPGAKYPKLKNQLCNGYNLSTLSLEELRKMKQVDLSYLINFYQDFPNKKNFFIKTSHFDRLAGGADLKKQIIAGMTVTEIRAGWQLGLEQFKQIRKQYLLYPDFE